MKLLLDTQVYLWFLADSRRLSRSARDAIARADVAYVSAASIWEIAIKVALGKIAVDLADVVAGIEASGFEELAVRGRQAERVASLPPHHRDPFDRLLVAQAMSDSLQLLTADTVLGAYTDLVVVV